MINVNLTYIRIDLVRCFRDVTNLLFTFAMPVFMYLLFGRAQYSDVQWGRGTVGFYVMSSMGPSPAPRPMPGGSGWFPGPSAS